MDRQILSQEEINALLRESDSFNSPPTLTLTAAQKDALGEIGNISYGSASTALSNLLNKMVTIDTPTVFVTTQRELLDQHPIPYVLIEVGYKKGLTGSNVLIIKELDAAIISDLMMGGDGRNPKQTLGQMELSAVGEAMNQMTGSASTSLSTLFSKRIEIAPPEVKAVDFSDGEVLISGHNNLDEQMVAISFKMQIEGLSDSEVMLLLPFQMATDMVDSLSSVAETIEPSPAPAPAPPSPAVAVPPVQSSPPSPEPEYYRIPEPALDQTPTIPGMPSFATTTANHTPVMVQPAQFGTIGPTKANKEPANIGLILDVPLQVTVELGSARMKIKEILELGLGSVIELDKLAGDPVDIYVNGKLIAKGEVVVIDENFGIKVTDIISPVERAHTLQ